MANSIKTFDKFRVFETEFAGRPLVVETGKMAQLANGSCLVRYGDTVVQAAVTASAKQSLNFLLYLPIQYAIIPAAIGPMHNNRSIYITSHKLGYPVKQAHKLWCRKREYEHHQHEYRKRKAHLPCRILYSMKRTVVKIICREISLDHYGKHIYRSEQCRNKQCAHTDVTHA